MALGAVVYPRGGAHMRGVPQTEFYRVDSDLGKQEWSVETAGIPQEYEGKSRLVVYYKRPHGILDSPVMCYFASD